LIQVILTFSYFFNKNYEFMNTHCLKKYTLIFASMMMFSLNLTASDLFDDVIFHVESNTQNATEPGLDCADIDLQDFEVKIALNGSAVVNSANFGAAANLNCDFQFSKDGRRTIEPELRFTQEGIQDVYFYIKGPSINATPMGPCPFEVNVLPQGGRIQSVKTSKF